MDPPALTSQAVGPTRGPQTKNRKPIGNLGHAPKFVAIGNLGHALNFRTIGKLGNDLLFVNIGNLGNGKRIAKIANDFGWQHALGGDGGTQPLVIGNIGKIVIMFQFARPYTNKPLQYGKNDNIANSPTIVLQINDLALAIIGNLTPLF